MQVQLPHPLENTRKLCSDSSLETIVLRHLAGLCCDLSAQVSHQVCHSSGWQRVRNGLVGCFQSITQKESQQVRPADAKSTWNMCLATTATPATVLMPGKWGTRSLGSDFNQVGGQVGHEPEVMGCFFKSCSPNSTAAL